MYDFYEFFAGGGMVRAGLGSGWSCRFANDFDHKKSRIYRLNWQASNELKTLDVQQLTLKDIPGRADLSWASFPCQDLSLAGGGAGLRGERSGTFWPFWNLMTALMADGRAPRLIILENVCGTLTSHNGRDFAAICAALREADYKFGALVLDAELFVPQSRPRLFIVATQSSTLPLDLITETPSDIWHPRFLRNAISKITPKAQENWVWWNLPKPRKRKMMLVDLIEDQPSGVEWHSAQETRQLLAMMNDTNLAKVKEAQKTGKRMVGCIYKRTRRDEFRRKVQRAEVRFDVSGCLRTPAGGSSRQLVLLVFGNSIKSRLISTRETARLMGLPDDYALPDNYNEAYHLTGDGVVVPVVRHLAANLFEPMLAHRESAPRKAA